jgi:hypothetical protein
MGEAAAFAHDVSEHPVTTFVADRGHGVVEYLLVFSSHGVFPLDAPLGARG